MIKDDLIILSSESCAPCNALKKVVGNKIPVYDIIKNDEAYKLAQKMEITGVPAVLKKEGNQWKKCHIFAKAGRLTIVCDGKDVFNKEVE